MNGRRALDLLAAGGLTVAGLIDLMLIPAHFAESVLSAATFTAIGGFQVALVRAPGRATYRAALLGTLSLITVWAGTRFIAPPTGFP